MSQLIKTKKSLDFKIRNTENKLNSANDRNAIEIKQTLKNLRIALASQKHKIWKAKQNFSETNQQTTKKN